VPLGEEIGDAFIEVHASTRGLSAELKRAARLAAREFPKNFSEAMGSELDPFLTPKGRRVRGSATAAGKLSGKNFSAAFRGEIKGMILDLDRSIRKGLLTGDWSHAIGMFDDVDQAMDGIVHRMEDLRKTNKKAFSKRDLEEATRQMEKYGEALKFGVVQTQALAENRSFDQIAARRKRDAADLERESARLAVVMRRQRDMDMQWGEERRLVFRDAIEDLIRLDGGVDRFTKNTHANLLRVTKDIRGSIGPDAIDRDAFSNAMHSIERDIERGGTALRGLRNRVKDVDKGFLFLGRLEGSRNNFFNFVGIVAGVAERAISKLVSTILDPRGLIDAFKAFGELVHENGGGITGFFQSLGQQLSTFFSGGDWVTALAKLLLVVSVFTQGFAFLGGAVAAVSEALLGLAVAAGGGAVLLAFMSMSKEAKALTAKTFKPITDFFNQVGDIARTNILGAFTDNLKGIKSVLTGFIGPLVVTASRLLADVIGNFVLALNDPEVKRTLDILSGILPLILGNLGKSLVDFSTGFLGFMAAVGPGATIITTMIADAAAKFTEFINTPTSQSSVAMFFVDAASALASIVDLAGSVTGALLTLFEQTNPAGQTLLDQITGIVDRFNAWLNTDEGRAKIASWMSLAQSLATKLWGAVQKVGAMIENLDTPQNRAIMLALIEFFGQMVDLTSRLAATGSNWLFNMIVFVGRAIEKVKDLIAWIKKAAAAFANNGMTVASGKQLNVSPGAINLIVPSAMQARQVASATIDALIAEAK
jgi:hypothetical protein